MKNHELILLLRITGGLILFLTTLGAVLSIYYAPTDLYTVFCSLAIIGIAIFYNLWIHWHSYLFEEH
jgi:hypothetical protein